jgi:hypothetical protein
MRHSGLVRKAGGSRRIRFRVSSDARQASFAKRPERDGVGGRTVNSASGLLRRSTGKYFFALRLAHWRLLFTADMNLRVGKLVSFLQSRHESSGQSADYEIVGRHIVAIYGTVPARAKASEVDPAIAIEVEVVSHLSPVRGFRLDYGVK